MMGPEARHQARSKKIFGGMAHIVNRLSRTHVFLFTAFAVSILLFTRFLSQSEGFSLPRLGTNGPELAPSIGGHPFTTLVAAARDEFSQVKNRQSQSLADAVAEYKRRNQLDPPPHFDKWYEFVQEHSVPLVDEYDGILELLRPFWGISPATVRKNVKQALNGDEFLIAFFIRGGEIKATERGEEWKVNAVRSAIEPFVQYLPDMDLAFNSHDEARVIIPHDQLSQLVERGTKAQMTFQQQSSSWSTRPHDMGSGSITASSYTPFLEYAHRFVWNIGTISCAPDSPARVSNYDGQISPDDLTPYHSLPLGFVQNRTAFTDVCLSPSLSDRHGFFNMPNSWSVTHDPVPVFSPSKVSTFHDIVYPAPWYLGNRVTYDRAIDRQWAEKKDALYWRGSTTSGFSAGGVWHHQERQRFVESVEKPGKGFVLQPNVAKNEWTPKQVSRETYKELFDVHFSHIGQCSDEDCAEQTQYFDVQEKASYERNWENKFLLDIDGNAFSGRFYTFLQSRSLTLKQAIFREWHENRVMPWVHYIPLGLNGTDHIEAMRFLTKETDGQRIAQEIALESTDWAYASLRQSDMQAWMFRLLLEYGRVVDDNRQHLGFRLP